MLRRALRALPLRAAAKRVVTLLKREGARCYVMMLRLKMMLLPKARRYERAQGVARLRVYGAMMILLRIDARCARVRRAARCARYEALGDADALRQRALRELR